MIIAVYPGSFDPVSNGHLDIIERSSRLFEKVYVLVSVNPMKRYTFSNQERVSLIKKCVSHLHNVEVEFFEGLVVDYAKKKQANVIIRGLRNENDYQNEITLYQFNHKLSPSMETIVMFPSGNNLFISSSMIKELVMFDGDISPYVPKIIKEEIIRKLK